MPDFNKILKTIDKALTDFDKQIPALQKQVWDNIQKQIQRLDVDDSGSLKQTVNNMQILGSVKNKLNRLILNDDYLSHVKEFADAFNTLATLQTEYWTAAEKDFKPKPLLREIRIQAIDSTIQSLTEGGITSNVSGRIAQVLQANITTGGSLFKMERILRTGIVGTKEFSGFIEGYTRQVTTDAINQYNAQYTQAVAAGLDFEWYAYQGSDIMTTRPFCNAMTDFRYFHVTEIPRLLSAADLYYVDKFSGERLKVTLNPKTDLPYGMIEGTNAANFFVNRGGYNCGHQIRPVSIDLVPADIQQRVFETAAYQGWKKARGK
jgi:hypothetical protein